MKLKIQKTRAYDLAICPFYFFKCINLLFIIKFIKNKFINRYTNFANRIDG